MPESYTHLPCFAKIQCRVGEELAPDLNALRLTESGASSSPT